MRLIGEFTSEKKAFGFHSFLLREKIKNVYELGQDPKTKAKQFRVWVVNEDDVEKASLYYKEAVQNPEDSRFNSLMPPPISSLDQEEIPEAFTEEDGLIIQEKPKSVVLLQFPLLTFIFILLCSLIFVVNFTEAFQMEVSKGTLALETGLTPLDDQLIFDYPQKVEALAKFIESHHIKTPDELRHLPPELKAEYDQILKIPTWDGILHYSKDAPLFYQIRQGQIWRLFTPIFLHRDILHILFNMMWVWFLGKPIEQRIRPVRYFALIIILACCTNILQYLMSGPFFMGFSGVAVGMAGFIWSRQKKAPWEGYPIKRGVLIFLFVFVIGMLALEIGSFVIDLWSHQELSAHIANTAHVSGGLLGWLLGKSSFFSRRVLV